MSFGPLTSLDAGDGGDGALDEDGWVLMPMRPVDKLTLVEHGRAASSIKVKGVHSA